jgi:hydrogenase maturation protease
LPELPQGSAAENSFGLIHAERFPADFQELFPLKMSDMKSIKAMTPGTGSVCPGLQKLLWDKRKKILFAGVGNLLRQDDGVGVRIAANLNQGERISSLVVEMSIENYIGKINRMAPDILVIIDACDFKREPGYSRLVTPSELNGVITNTHNISLKRISTLFNMQVFILGVQPSCTRFGEMVSRNVNEAAILIIKTINMFTNF